MGEDSFLNSVKREREVLYTLRKSRKAFLAEYFCGIFLLSLMAVIVVKEITLPNAFQWFIVGVAFVSIGSAEVSRQLLRYKVMENKLEIVQGIIKQNKKNVYFAPLGFVPDLNIKQGRWQRLLGYGTVYLKSGGENTFEIKEVNKPQDILEMIEKLIEHNKRGSSMSLGKTEED